MSCVLISSFCFERFPRFLLRVVKVFPCSLGWTNTTTTKLSWPGWEGRNAAAAEESEQASAQLQTVCNTQKALQSNDMPPSPPLNPTLLQLVFFFPLLSIQVFTPPNPHFYLYYPSPPTYKPPFYCSTKAAMFVFVTCLLSLVPLMFWQSPQQPFSHILTTSFQPSPRLQ